jgi:hypothetical protein
MDDVWIYGVGMDDVWRRCGGETACPCHPMAPVRLPARLAGPGDLWGADCARAGYLSPAAATARDAACSAPHHTTQGPPWNRSRLFGQPHGMEALQTFDYRLNAAVMERSVAVIVAQADGDKEKADVLWNLIGRIHHHELDLSLLNLRNMDADTAIRLILHAVGGNSTMDVNNF